MTRRRGVVNGHQFAGVFALHPTNKAEKKGEAVPGFGAGPHGEPTNRELEIALVGGAKVHPVKCLCVPSVVLGTAPVPLIMLHVTLHTLQAGKPGLTEFSAFPPSWYSSTVTQDSLMVLGRAWEWTRMETLASAWVSAQGEGNQKNT